MTTLYREITILTDVRVAATAMRSKLALRGIDDHTCVPLQHVQASNLDLKSGGGEVDRYIINTVDGQAQRVY